MRVQNCTARRVPSSSHKLEAVDAGGSTPRVDAPNPLHGECIVEQRLALLDAANTPLTLGVSALGARGRIAHAQGASVGDS